MSVHPKVRRARAKVDPELQKTLREAKQSDRAAKMLMAIKKVEAGVAAQQDWSLFKRSRLELLHEICPAASKGKKRRRVRRARCDGEDVSVAQAPALACFSSVAIGFKRSRSDRTASRVPPEYPPEYLRRCSWPCRGDADGASFVVMMMLVVTVSW